MFAELNSILNTSPDDVTQREFILLSDRKADGSFLIHHYLSFYLKAGCKVCFVGLVQSFSHYSAVAQRLGVNLLQARDKGQLVFVEALKASAVVMLNESSSDEAQLFDYLRSPVPELRSLFEFVRSCLTQARVDSVSAPVLIVDDLSVLLSLGVSVGAVLDFTHYCQSTICSQLQGSVVTLVRCDDDDDEEDGDDEDTSSSRLLRALSHQCTLSLSVEGLQTGYCKDIHGQVEIWWRGTGENMQSQRKIFQYKVYDKGASFFAPGTSSAVL